MTSLPCLSDSRVDCYSTINKLRSYSGYHTGTKVWGKAENRASLGSLTDRSGHRTRYLQDKIKLSIGLNFSKPSSLNVTILVSPKRTRDLQDWRMVTCPECHMSSQSCDQDVCFKKSLNKRQVYDLTIRWLIVCLLMCTWLNRGWLIAYWCVPDTDWLLTNDRKARPVMCLRLVTSWTDGYWDTYCCIRISDRLLTDH